MGPQQIRGVLPVGKEHFNPAPKRGSPQNKSLSDPGVGPFCQGSVAADVIGSSVEVDEPLMAAGMDCSGWGLSGKETY